MLWTRFRRRPDALRRSSRRFCLICLVQRYAIKRVTIQVYFLGLLPSGKVRQDRLCTKFAFPEGDDEATGSYLKFCRQAFLLEGGYTTRPL